MRKQNDFDSIKKSLEDHKYELLGQIGEGGQGSVFLVRSEKYQELFVAKRIPYKSSQSVTSEVEVLLNLQHPNIINMYEYWSDVDTLYVIFEYCPNGSLRDMIRSHGPLDSTQLWQVCKDVVAAVCFCHENGIVHRDIKPANLLIDKYNRVKLADFGLSATGESVAHAHQGSPAYMAPEKFTPHFKMDHFKCDVWSLGVTLFELGTGSLPWSCASLPDMIAHIQMGLQRRPMDADYSFFKLLKQMMTVKPAQRISMFEVLKSEYFVEHEQKLLEPTRRIVRSHDPKFLSSPKLTASLPIGCGIQPVRTNRLRPYDSHGVLATLNIPLQQRGYRGPARSSRQAPIVKPSLSPICT